MRASGCSGSALVCRSAGCASQRDRSICPQLSCVRLDKHHGMVRGLSRGLSLRCSRYAPPKRLSAPTRITGGDVHRGAVNFEAARYGSLQIRPRFPVSHPPPGNSTSYNRGPFDDPMPQRAMFMRVVEFPTLNVQDSAEPSG
ncbi:hypothetical protein GE21DRAFT_1311023 [Neurospora crassa]|nr:hypothetical protein GE21DRAFT_1311023 [Neurospora crassa]